MTTWPTAGSAVTVPLGPAAPEGPAVPVVAGVEVDVVLDLEGRGEHGVLDPGGWFWARDAGTVVAGETTALDPIGNVVDVVDGTGSVVLVDVVDDWGTVVEVVVVDAWRVVVVLGGAPAGWEGHGADGVAVGWVLAVVPGGLADPDDGYTTV